MTFGDPKGGVTCFVICLRSPRGVPAFSVGTMTIPKRERSRRKQIINYYLLFLYPKTISHIEPSEKANKCK